MKFKVGQKWKTRCGSVVEITSVDGDDPNHPLEGFKVSSCPNDKWTHIWTRTGFYCQDENSNMADLVELIEDETPVPSPPEVVQPVVHSVHEDHPERFRIQQMRDAMGWMSMFSETMVVKELLGVWISELASLDRVMQGMHDKHRG